MECHPIRTTVCASLIFASAALAHATETTIHALPMRGAVTLFGTVERITSDEEFTLRDDSGRVTVRQLSGDRAILDEGDSVTVIGNVAGGENITASRVRIHRRAAI
jgi:hypothetical protein